MNKFDKILLFFILLIGFILSIAILSLFYPLPFIHDLVKEYYRVFSWLNDVFVGYSVIICLCFVILLIITVVSPNQSSLLVMTKNKGKLLFSKKTIESTISYSFSKLDEISSSKIKIKINEKPEKTKIYVKLFLNDTSHLVALTETVQSNIASILETSLGITVKTITIKIIGISPKNTKPEEIHEVSRNNSVI